MVNKILNIKMYRFVSILKVEDVYGCIQMYRFEKSLSSVQTTYFLMSLVFLLRCSYNKITMAITLHKRIKIKLLLVQFIAIIPLLLFIFYIFDLWYDTRKTLVFQENINIAKVSSLAIREVFSRGETIGSFLGGNDEFDKYLHKDKNKAKEFLK